MRVCFVPEIVKGLLGDYGKQLLVIDEQDSGRKVVTAESGIFKACHG